MPDAETAGAPLRALRDRIISAETSGDLAWFATPDAAGLTDALHREAVGPDLTGPADAFLVLGTAYWCRFLAGGGADEEPLAAAVYFLLPVYAASPGHVPDALHPVLEVLRGGTGDTDSALLAGAAGVGLVAFHQRHRYPLLLRGAETLLRHALGAIPADDPLHGFCQSTLGVVLHHIAAEEAAPALLTEAVELCRAAAAAPVDDAAERARRLGNLGRTLISRGDEAAVAEGADATRRALALTADGTPYHTVLIANLADALLRQAAPFADPSMLEDAVALYRQALAAMPAGDPERAERMFTLGLALITRATAPASGPDEDGDHEDRRARLYTEGAASIESAIAATPADADRLRFTATLAYARYGWGELTADETVLAQAETEARRVSDVLSADHPLHAQALFVRGEIHAARFDLRGDERQQGEAISAARQAAELTPPGSPLRAARVAGLCAKLRVRARQADDAAAAAEAAGLARAALREAAPGSSDRARLLFELGVALQAAAALAPGAGPDREGLDCLRECLDLPAPGNQFGAHVRWELGRALAGTPGAPGDDWRRGAGLVREAVALLPPGSPSRADYLSSLAHLLLRRAEAGGEPWSAEEQSAETQSAESLFAEAADLSRQAAVAAARGTAQEAARRSNLGAVLVTYGRYVGDAELLAEAVRSHRAAVAATGPADFHLPMRLGNLGDALRTLAEQTSDAALLTEAIEVGREALRRVPPGHPLRRQCLAQLGMCLRARSEFDDDPAPLPEAADCLREAAGLAQEAGQPAFAARHTLANVLADVGAYTGDAGPWEEAIGLLRAELAGGDGDLIAPAERAMALHSLGWATFRQASDRNDDTRQEDAIGMLREAAALLPERHFGRTAIFMSLGAALLERSESAAEPAWALEAVDVLRTALAECPERGSRRGGALSNLSAALRHAYDATDDRRYLDESAARAAEAESLGFGPGQSRAYGKLNLAVARHFEAAARADPRALADAIVTLEDALRELPASHPLRPRYLVNLAALYWTGTELAGDPLSLRAGGSAGARRAPEAAAPLRRAAEAAREALASLPGQHPDRARAEWALAQVQLRRAQHGEQVDLGEVTRLARSAAESPSAPVETRLRAARVLGEASAARGQDAEALEGYAYAVGLLARAAPRSLTRAAQEDRLGLTHGLASDAAAMALRAGDAGRALALLEQGRGILLSQALELRGDLSRLRTRAPALAREFERLRDALGADTETAAALLTPGAGPAGTGPASSRAARLADARHAMARRWDPLIEQIRNLDEDMTGFLRPPDVPELRAAADLGPVVVVNVSRYRSDAILVTTRGIDVVELPQLAPRTVLSRALSFGPLVDMAYGARGEDLIPGAVDHIAGILEWLWDTVCYNVLDRLKLRYTPDDGKPWPRIYWCPTGWLSFLPLHAAGRRSGAGQSVLDRVVSSYTPTLRALLRARAQLESYPKPAPPPDPLVVSLPRTPGGAVLVGAADEAKTLARLFPGRTRELAGQAATVAAVGDALPAHSWVHFGCHGVTDPEHPSAAGLQLHDGRLRALDAAALPLREPMLAMLAACSTSQGGTAIPDEAIHVASSFQLAGYPHVIGTLWPVSDRFSARLTEQFYAALAADSADGRPADPAVALHSAVRALRADGLAAAPHLWAAHTHTGP